MVEHTAGRFGTSCIGGIRVIRTLSQRDAAELKSWKMQTKVYGAVNVFDRIFLIIGSAVVAADQTFLDSRGEFLLPWISVLAVCVTVVAAFDAWLKPREKWRGFMAD